MTDPFRVFDFEDDTDETPAAHFKLEPFEAIKATTMPNYLVKGIVPREGITVVWGPPKCGKSFWTFDLFMHVALGRRYRGHKVKQGSVVYLALEGGGGFRARVEAWRRQNLADHRGAVPFYLLAVPVDLVADHNNLIAAIHAQVDTPTAVVIDTLNRSLVGSENDPKDVAKFIRAADMIRAAFSCAVIIIHHCGVEGSRPRGHTSLEGADDAQIALERDVQTGIIQAKVEHMKDGEAGATIFSRLESVSLGNDDEGDPITSCIIVPVEGEGLKRRPKLPDSAKLALDLLAEAIIDYGEKPPVSNHVPPDKNRVVRVDHFWRHFCAGIVDDLQSPDSKRRAFKRATERLQKLGVIGVWNDLIWITGQTGQGRTN
jgi:AAA domain